MNHESACIVLGGGVVGCYAALLLARQGLSTHIIDIHPLGSNVPLHQGKVFAITRASRTRMASDALWDRSFDEPFCVFHGVQIVQLSPFEQVHYQDTTCADPLATLIPSEKLRNHFQSLIAKAKHVTWHQDKIRTVYQMGNQCMVLGGNRVYHAPLVLLATGGAPTFFSHSLKIRETSYRQFAIAGRLYHQPLSQQHAFEIMLANGDMMALLPAGKGEFALVWTTKEAQNYPMDVRKDTLHSTLKSLVGPITLASPLHCYPLIRRIPLKRTADRMLALGDSACMLHPLAGQGLNWGLRDTYYLMQDIAAHARLSLDIGDATFLSLAERRRVPDLLRTLAFNQGLLPLLTYEGARVQMLRKLGMQVVQHTQPLMEWIIRKGLA